MGLIVSALFAILLGYAMSGASDSETKKSEDLGNSSWTILD